MKVKIISSNISYDDLENKTSDWTKDLNPKIVSLGVNAIVMHDYYSDSAPPRICNTWHEYICSIVYEL
jgi:hypothetical protein